MLWSPHLKVQNPAGYGPKHPVLCDPHQHRLDQTILRGPSALLKCFDFIISLVRKYHSLLSLFLNSQWEKEGNTGGMNQEPYVTGIYIGLWWFCSSAGITLCSYFSNTIFPRVGLIQSHKDLTLQSHPIMSPSVHLS